MEPAFNSIVTVLRFAQLSEVTLTLNDKAVGTQKLSEAVTCVCIGRFL